MDNGCQWIFGPADSPWNQGAVEALVKSAKRCLKFAIGSQRVTASEFMTVCYEAANMLNERPLGRMPAEDSEINILRPNCLLLGRSTSSILDSSRIGICNQKTRVGLTNLIAEEFWKKWTDLYAPTMVNQSKWKIRRPNYQVGDVVQVADPNSLRSQYYVAQVASIHPDKDGVVRRVSLRYKPHKVSGNARNYTGSAEVLVTRSVHRIAPLVTVEEM